MGNYVRQDTVSSPEEVDSTILSAQAANHSTGFGSSYHLTELAI